MILFAKFNSILLTQLSGTKILSHNLYLTFEI